MSQELRRHLTGHATDKMNDVYSHLDKKLLKTAVNKLPVVSAAGNSPPPGGTKPGQVNTVFYCNRTVRSALDIQAMSKTNNFLTLETRASKPYMAFRGIPIRICDQITNSEARVT